MCSQHKGKCVNSQWLPYILPKVCAVTSFASYRAATDTDSQSYLVGNLGKDLLCIYIFEHCSYSALQLYVRFAASI